MARKLKLWLLLSYVCPSVLSVGKERLSIRVRDECTG